jgi:hypothetical protein
MSTQTVYKFKITLTGIKPTIWRHLVVPSNYSFWDLHVAIQNAMGWMDYHLHEFTVINPDSGRQELIGVPNDDTYGDQVLASWKKKLKKYIGVNNKMQYIYDFGDHWVHEIKFEGVHEEIQGMKYPICTAGARACPPEDIGGIFGYEEFLEAINNPKDERYEEMLELVGGVFDPEAFDPTQVIWSDPEQQKIDKLIEV